MSTCSSNHRHGQGDQDRFAPSWRSRRASALATGAMPKFRITRTVYGMTGLATSPRELDLLVSRNAAYTFGYYRRLARLLEPDYRRRLQKTITPIGADRLASAEKHPPGVILLSAHVGDFDLAGSWIAEVLGRSPVVPVATLGRPIAQRLFAVARKSYGFTLALRESTSMQDLEGHLSAGRIVILTLDRWTGGRAIEVELLGRPARVPAASLALARRTGAPLVSAATWNIGAERVLVFGKPLTIDPARDPRAEATVMQQLSRELEGAIRAAPHQWHIPADPRQLPLLLEHRTAHHLSKRRAYGVSRAMAKPS